MILDGAPFIQARSASKGIAGFLTVTCQLIANRHDTLVGASCLYFSLSNNPGELAGAVGGWLG